LSDPAQKSRYLGIKWKTQTQRVQFNQDTKFIQSESQLYIENIGSGNGNSALIQSVGVVHNSKKSNMFSKHDVMARQR